MQDDRDDIRDAVKAEMDRQGVTMNRMGTDIGLDETVISRWLQGRTSTNTRNASAMMRYLGIRIGFDDKASES